MIQKQRNPYWDSAKAVLIFLVILGHMIQYMGDYAPNSFWSHPVFKSIYMFHMPLFVLMSGFFSAGSIGRRGWASFPRYVKRLIVPCMAYGLFFRVIPHMLTHGFSCSGVYERLFELWFLVVIMECISFYLILISIKNAVWRGVWCILPLLVGLLASEIPTLNLMFPHSGQFSYLWPFFLAGIGMKSWNITISRIDAWWLLSLPIYAVAYYYFEATWYVYLIPPSFSWHDFGINAYRTLSACVGCALFLCLVKYMAPYLGKCRIVLGIGRATLAIYLVQSLCFIVIVICREQIGCQLGTIDCIIASLVLLLLIYGFYYLTRRVRIIAFLFYGESFRKTKCEQNLYLT